MQRTLGVKWGPASALKNPYHVTNNACFSTLEMDLQMSKIETNQSPFSIDFAACELMVSITRYSRGQ